MHADARARAYIGTPVGVGFRLLARHALQLSQFFFKQLALRLQAKYPETDKHTRTHPEHSEARGGDLRYLLTFLVL